MGKKPFSGKAKKQQMRDKRERLRERALEEEEERYRDLSPPPAVAEASDPDPLIEGAKHRVAIDESPGSVEGIGAAILAASVSAQRSRFDRLNTVFAADPKDEIERRKKEALKPLNRNVAQVLFNPIKNQIPMPMRPDWSYSMTREEVDRQEQQYFQDWIDHIYRSYNIRDLNFFEHNLEVWRQLWRVLEISDVLLLVTDIRYPLFHFPASLYDYVVSKLGKQMIVVLNKVDLVPEANVVAWETWLQTHFPHLTLARFTSYPYTSEDGRRRYQRASGVLDVINAVRETKSPACAKVDWESLVEKCRSRDAAVAGPPLSKLEAEAVILASERRLLQEEFEADRAAFKAGELDGPRKQATPTHSRRKRKEQVGKRPVTFSAYAHQQPGAVIPDSDSEEEVGKPVPEPAPPAPVDPYAEPPPTEAKAQQKSIRSQSAKAAARTFKSLSDEEESDVDEADAAAAAASVTRNSNIMTVAMVGHPNVGKSALLNGLMGKKVVSVKGTPGHTKHLQTHFMASDFRLCDCPGLVFPATGMPKSLQVLCGIFPIANYREAVVAVQYLAERVPIERILQLEPPPQYVPKKGPYEWSAFDVCEAYALKRGYMTARSARPDVYRAANEMLRKTYNGQILLAFPPPPADLDTTPTTATVMVAQPRKHIPGTEQRVVKKVAESDDDSEGDSVVPVRPAASRNAFDLLGDDD
eukprot:TRINITY_DN898_c0_g1_i1.p1 TRINITY_DN898_c0_g1~~TRINITY_DN898_c0_g1_i1.p1  ORF type:complete len:697 (-),score=191.41 TRINITY_DN898_c0_g1_i1:1093-3183(-)